VTQFDARYRTDVSFFIGNIWHGRVMNMSIPHEIVNSIGHGDLVFDIGANIGDKAAWFLQRGARVVCVEPQPDMVKVLREKFSGNKNIEIVPCGLGAENGDAKMYICSTAPVLSTFADHWKEGRFATQQWDRVETLPIVTLDKLVEMYGTPKYCKIDVEGSEENVVKGLSKKAGIISFEFTGEFIDRSMNVLRLLIMLGYEDFNLSLGESDKFYFSDWMKFQNIVTILMNSAQQNSVIWGDIYAR
jgi:FkbM family methyltransferase